MENIRGSLSGHLEGRTIVLGVCGSIAAVKSVELARELIRHGASVVPVMTEAATRILHPDALEFATGNKPILRLTGAVEHIALLGDVQGKADLLLVAPATANTVSKMALGIDDSPVTTCATVAFGTRTPVVVAPAMHEAMLEHPIIGEHAQTLRARLGVTWVEPVREERKAKLADVEAIVEAVIHRLASDGRRPGPLAGQRALVISGATLEPLDDVRVITNRSSGRSGHVIATELHRLGADVNLWQGHATEPVPSFLAKSTARFSSHADLLAMAQSAPLSEFGQIWMPAAIGDFALAAPAPGKVPSDRRTWEITLHPLPKIIELVRRRAPNATLVAFKAEATGKTAVARARNRLKRYRADFVVANAAASFGAAETDATLIGPRMARRHRGPKTSVLASIVAEVAKAPKRKPAKRKSK